ncbi:iron ABC transporter substrate-binding protein [Paenibacillus jamilae]|uniref:iron uptake system protein EfeO n=1 Tax=Paenibacillus jamilae TaxID=114136 RepID=UPI0007AB523F|nr:iron uptake system protein EfeO [Paenibacillus jamilae]KZE74496.1 iron ABC transporter substrate-binding protein [Paenibacillus jamilae]
MKLRYAVPAGVLVSSILFAGCGQTGTADTQPAATSKDTGAATQTTTAAETAPNFDQAVAAYRTYATEQCDTFVKKTEEFTNAVKAGQLDKAKSLYAPARMYYERIEPIAEALGDLDPNIDARDGDVDAADWRGFHRIEKTLWEENTTKGLNEYSDRLLSDAKLLRAKVETVNIDASLMVTGAVELLNEVSTSKVTGEEERYSHTDLYDFAANVEGAQKIYDILKTDLNQKDAVLEKQIGERFTALQQELAPFKDGEGYVSYTKLKPEEIKKLSQNLDALAEPLSQMGKLLGV